MIDRAPSEPWKPYDATELSAIVDGQREALRKMAADLRDARQRIVELEEEATKP